MESTQFIYNGRTRSFFNTLVENLQQCSEFKISVAFITYGGLQVLLETLQALSERKIPGEILTTTYQNMTTPEVLKRLSEFPNIKIKVYVPPTEKEGFHAKGYLFHKSFSGKDQWTVIIGSSNITGRALKTNVEWNVLQNEPTQQAQEPGVFAKSVLDEFEQLWKSPWAKEYSDDFLISYRDYLARIKKDVKVKKINELFTYERSQAIQPNEMQQEAIVKLDRLRKTGATKALAIAATGSGKTYMSVFDALQVKPKKLLFIVHREDILKKAKESFDTICGATEKNYVSGFYTGNQKDTDCTYLFATRDTMSRHYEEFSPNAFDYIVIDEAHHASSESYQKILSHFKPDFLLGLTATPERSDNGDIYALFDNNIAVEIRLRQALEYNLICPFHYFGLTDAEGIDYSKITAEPGTSEYTDSIAKMLMVGHRVDYIIKKMKFYGHDGQKAKVLGFCQTVKHAKYMAEEFCKRGIPSVALSSEDNKSIDERIAFTKRLENDDDELQVIFTVDLFNEGIDIPSVNTILMLRPTESSIIFIQQLGRGLRKLADKEFVTVLDFIGNYNKSFLMAIALNGKQNFDKDSLKVEVETDFADLPNGTYIHMDKITKQQILHQLESERFMSMKYMKESYLNFKHVCGGKVPMLIDYLKHDGSVDPLRFSSFNPTYKTYLEFSAYMEKETHPELSLLLENESFKQLLRLFTFYTPAKRIEEFVIAECLLNSTDGSVALEQVENQAQKYLELVKKENIIHAAETLSGKYFDSSELNRYVKCLLEFDGKTVSFKDEVKSALFENKNSKVWFEDLIQYNLMRYQDDFGSSDYGFPFLKPYYEYSMRDTALLCNYKKIHSSFRGQGLLTSAKPDYFIFVNLHKNANIKESINYKDKFISQGVFQWQSPNSTTQDSEVGQNIIFSYKRGINLHLFVRKFEEVEGVTQPFVYLGKVVPFSDSAEGNKPITIHFALENPVPDELYLDFKTRTDALGKESESD
ncbi:DUF3427 domain-containing protein [Treponema ruminis]|uniref:Superfamily II DNA or RNA helicase n=1 Tax=Treponema ruminis TaxID=744515 RepID=A0A7W8GAG3_9SPIR|nr:DUF3427 domain-containing protein [Treponema ruminis]MBB5226837.1 superfamily II DNA or RNA helicase [Treponema ruminis]QSI01268.1 DUF3427 domain-containing protein [Treponema ruminis]